MPIDSFCAWDADTLVLNILGTPNAGCDAIGEPKGKQLRISVTEKPVAGRATDHMVRFLADQFGVAVGDIEVVLVATTSTNNCVSVPRNACRR